MPDPPEKPRMTQADRDRARASYTPPPTPEALGRDINVILQRLAATDSGNIQAVAASQIGLLDAYHRIALAQSSRSFAWALVGAGMGLALFVVAAGFSLWTGNAVAAVIPAVSGAVVEVVAGIVFYLYGKTTSQLGDFHSRLERLQRYLLANSICESLQDEAKETTRSALVREIARIVERP